MLPSIFGEDLFDDFFGDPFEMMVPQSRNPLYGKHAKNLMKTDVRETEDSYELDIDLRQHNLNLHASLQASRSGSEEYLQKYHAYASKYALPAAK